jgi:hypothetical protein
MKGSMRAAAAIGIGYVLGRRRKFRTAAMMAAGMSIGGTAVGALVLKRGMKMLGSTDAIQKVAPQLGDLADVVRGDLVTAGKAAATAAVTSRVDALTGSIHDRAERVRNAADTVAEGAEEATKAGSAAAGTGRRAATGTAKRAGDAADGTGRRLTGRGRATEPEAHEAHDDYEADETEVDDDYEDDYPEDDHVDEADEAPVRRTTTRRRSPVSRTKR